VTRPASGLAGRQPVEHVGLDDRGQDFKHAGVHGARDRQQLRQLNGQELDRRGSGDRRNGHHLEHIGAT
jgi:hypothetical protein